MNQHSEDNVLHRNRRALIAAARQGKRTFELEGRLYDLAKHHHSNVTYLAVSPREGISPRASLIMDPLEYNREMERRRPRPK